MQSAQPRVAPFSTTTSCRVGRVLSASIDHQTSRRHGDGVFASADAISSHTPREIEASPSIAGSVSQPTVRMIPLRGACMPQRDTSRRSRPHVVHLKLSYLNSVRTPEAFHRCESHARASRPLTALDWDTSTTQRHSRGMAALELQGTQWNRRQTRDSRRASATKSRAQRTAPLSSMTEIGM